MKQTGEQVGKKAKKRGARPGASDLFYDRVDRTGINTSLTVCTILGDFVDITRFNDCINRATGDTTATGDALFCYGHHLKISLSVLKSRAVLI